MLCITCKQNKSEQDFYNCNNSWCKKCFKIREKLRQRNKRQNPEFVKKEKVYYKEWYKKNGRNRAINYAEVIKEWRINHPEITKAYLKFNEAIKNGKIMKALLCEKCGNETKLVGHHEDYNKPLEVIWLCQSCHKKLHSKSLT